MTNKLVLYRRFLHELGSGWKKSITLYYRRACWRLLNPHNRTIANTIFDLSLVEVGKGSYGHLNVHSYGNINEKLIIGNYCSIAGGVHFILSGGHEYTRFSTFPFSVYYGERPVDATGKGAIIIQDDVWIGYGAIVLSGVTIGKGAVIAAGSIVTKDVPKYSIWIGNKVYGYRFSDSIIKKLNSIDYNCVDPTLIANNPILSQSINEDNIDMILEVLQNKDSNS